MVERPALRGMHQQTASQRAMALLLPVYITLIAGAELATALLGVVIGAIAHALLLVALLNHFVVLNRPSRAVLSDPNSSYWFKEALVVLALLPLLRLLNLTIVVPGLPVLAWYVLVGTPLLPAITLAARFLGRPWSAIGFARGAWLPQAGIALTGLPLGYLAYLLVRPQPLIADPDAVEIILGAIILTVFVGFPTEVIFRGMLQRLVNEVFDRAGLFWSSIAYAAMHVVSLSPAYVLFAGCVGLVFGWHVNRIGAVWGVAIAHGLMLGGMLLVWPNLLR